MLFYLLRERSQKAGEICRIATAGRANVGYALLKV